METITVKEAIDWTLEDIGKAADVALPLDKGVDLAQQLRATILRAICPPKKSRGYRIISKRCYLLACPYAFETTADGKIVKKKGKCLAAHCPREDTK